MKQKSEQEIIKSWKGDITIPVISISCVTYNHEKYISEAVDSFLMQETEYAFEVVIGEDCSTDKTLEIVKKYIPQPWKIKFFIYCRPSMDIVTDVYARILWCKENKVLPYFMRDLSCWQSENASTYNDFSAWCNQPGIFKNHTFKEFCIKRHPSKKHPDCFPVWFVELMEAKMACE